MSRLFRMMASVALGTLGLSPAARAQGCILCYTSAANGGPGAMHAFQLGVLTLLVPALLLFVGIFLLILRRAAAAPA
jgi:hypothetical protein